MSKKLKRVMIIAPFAILGIAVFIFLGGAIVMRLWNWLMPPLFGWRVLRFWQALGLLTLCRILFGGFGRHGSTRTDMRGRIKERMAERWEKMSPEQRERARQSWRGRWGFTPPAGTPSSSVPPSSGSPSSGESKE